MEPRVAITRPAPLAFPALLLGAAALAVGPLFVREAGVAPIVSAFWRLALAVPFVLGIAFVTRQPGPSGARSWGLLAVAGVLFAVDIAAWHLGIVRTTLGNSVLFGNVSSFMLAGYGFVLARAWPSRRFALAMFAGGGVGGAAARAVVRALRDAFRRRSSVYPRGDFLHRLSRADGPRARAHWCVASARGSDGRGARRCSRRCCRSWPGRSCRPTGHRC